MVILIRVRAVSDYLELLRFDELFHSILGWEGLGSLK
jgi:hypothetical protein